jgi:hypothetical protein
MTKPTAEIACLRASFLLYGLVMLIVVAGSLLMAAFL